MQCTTFYIFTTKQGKDTKEQNRFTGKVDEEAIKTWISHKNRALEKKRFCLKEKYYYVEKKLLMLMRVHGFLYATQKSLWASRRCKSEDLEISVFYLCSILLRSHKLHCCAFFSVFFVEVTKMMV